MGIVVNLSKSNNSRTSMNGLPGHCKNCFFVTVDIESRRCVSVNFDVIVPLIKSFCLIQGHVK